MNLMIGRTFRKVFASPDEMIFEANDGTRFVFYHEQDCCETVRIEEIIGDLKDLTNRKLLQAEEVSNADGPYPRAESYTWTFYKFATNRGSVTVRWLGESNGYYSESVDLHIREPLK